jgi:hypothetical protein
VREFTVAAQKKGNMWAHEWWFSLENPTISTIEFMNILDEELKNLNDDYAFERIHALKNVNANFIPLSFFHDFLKHKSKFNGQAKIPRVLKGENLTRWKEQLTKM